MNEEKLLREFIAALEALNEIHLPDEISAPLIKTYSVKDKLVELKLRLWNLL